MTGDLRGDGGAMSDRRASPPEAVDALVIGGGPAGLRAAEALAAAGRRVVVAERMPTLARKLLMAGRSGLNLTRQEGASAMAPAYGAAWARLAPILAETDAEAVQAWARGLGQPLYEGSTGRVFPEAMKASPLLRAWRARLEAGGVEFRTRWRWTGGVEAPTGGGTDGEGARGRSAGGGASGGADAAGMREGEAPGGPAMVGSGAGEPDGCGRDRSAKRAPRRSPPPAREAEGEPEGCCRRALRGSVSGRAIPAGVGPTTAGAVAPAVAARDGEGARPSGGAPFEPHGPGASAAFLFDTPEGPRAIRPAVAVLALGGGVVAQARLGRDVGRGRSPPRACRWRPSPPPTPGSPCAGPSPWRAISARPSRAWRSARGGQVSRGEVVVSARGLEGGGLYPLTPPLRAGAPLALDLAPDRDEGAVAAALARVPSKVSLANRLRRALRLSPVKAALLREWGDPSVPLAARIKALPGRHDGLRPMDEAISTAGRRRLGGAR